MSTTQMNLRIDAQVKERGDAALAQAGYSPSRAVRAIWEFAASHTHDPQAVKNLLEQAEPKQDSDKQARIRAKMEALERVVNLNEQLEHVVGSGPSSAVNIDEASDKTMRAEALLSRWEERGFL